MKKIFLIFGLAAGTGAFAQQDIFDINRHLQKQSKQKTFPGNTVAPYYSLQNQTIPGSPAPMLRYSLADGDTVVYAPGMMPVIITDMSAFTIMPNVCPVGKIPGSNFPGKPLPGEMPNGAKPLHHRLLVTK